MIIIMKNCNDFQVHRCIECMGELEAAKDQGSSRLQTSQERSCFQCKGIHRKHSLQFNEPKP